MVDLSKVFPAALHAVLPGTSNIPAANPALEKKLAESLGRVRKTAPRVTHWILIHPWAVYCVDAETVTTAESEELQRDGWIPVVAVSELAAKNKGESIRSRIIGAARGR